MHAQNINVLSADLKTSLALMRPQSGHLRRCLAIVRLDHKHALEDLGYVTQIEYVVRFCGRWQQLFADGVIQVDSGCNNSVRKSLHRCLELRDPSLENGAKDLCHYFIIRRRHTKHHKVAHESGSQLRAASARGRCSTHENSLVHTLPNVGTTLVKALYTHGHIHKSYPNTYAQTNKHTHTHTHTHSHTQIHTHMQMISIHKSTHAST